MKKLFPSKAGITLLGTEGIRVKGRIVIIILPRNNDATLILKNYSPIRIHGGRPMTRRGSSNADEEEITKTSLPIDVSTPRRPWADTPIHPS